MSENPTVVSLQRQQHLAVITINNPPVNALSQAVRQGLLESMQSAESDPDIKAIIIDCQGRTFVAGADISEFDAPPQPPSLFDVFYRIDQCSKPVIAALFGTALGGGFELALACHYRVALAGSSLGLPEVNLGLLPGAGGTQWLPRIAGLELSLSMMTSGKPQSAEALLAYGVVDQIIADAAISDGSFLAGVIDYSHQLLATGLGARPVSAMPVNRADNETGLLDQWRATLAKKAKGQIAPQAIIDCIEDAITLPFLEGQAQARQRFLQCKASSQSRAMRHAFFAERRASKVEDLPEGTKAHEVNTVAVIGAGTMGSAIAMCFANAHIPVTLLECNAQQLTVALDGIKKRYQHSVSSGRIDAQEMDRRMACIHTSCEYECLADCDVVVEAAFESMEVKQSIFKQLDQICKPEAVLASNTSYLDIDAIASVTSRPGNIVGLHFFSPADIMKLLEIVRGSQTSASVIKTAVALAKRLGKIPVVVGNAYGFVGNRMYTSYGREAQMLLLEGATPAQVDKAMTDWGMAMGPFAVNDMSGIDIAYKARRQNPNLPDDPCYFRPADILVEAGRLGKKTGAGFYRYNEHTGQRENDPEAISLIRAEAKKLSVPQRDLITDQDIQQRLIGALIDEGHALLKRGIASRASDIDVIWLNGYGFPRFRGGPMCYADELSLKPVEGS